MLYRRNRFLTLEPRQLLCNAIQPYFDYACSAWYTKTKKASNYAKQMYLALPLIK